MCMVVCAEYEWPPFGKELLSRLTVCFVMVICMFSYSPFWFRGCIVTLLTFYFVCPSNDYGIYLKLIRQKLFVL